MPSGWTKSADGLTCVFEEKKTETPNKVSNAAKPVCISGFAYSSTTAKCEKNTIASQFTANKAYAYMGALKLGPNPQEEDKCLNFSGTQTAQPANSYQSGGGNCACNSGFQYNNLSGDSASCLSECESQVVTQHYLNNGNPVTCPNNGYVIGYNGHDFYAYLGKLGNNGSWNPENIWHVGYIYQNWQGGVLNTTSTGTITCIKSCVGNIHYQPVNPYQPYSELPYNKLYTVKGTFSHGIWYGNPKINIYQVPQSSNCSSISFHIVSDLNGKWCIEKYLK